MPWKNDDRWSSLLPELLLRILTRMSCAADRVRFGSVCTWWRLVLTESRHLLPPTDPLLMLPYTEDDPSPCQVYDIPISWVHRVLLPDSRVEPMLPLDQQKMRKVYHCHRRPKKVVFGSSMGWLFLDDCGVFSLWNPVTRAEIPLPLLVTVPTILYRSIEKVALSANPNSEDCVVMVICRDLGSLSFCRVGDEKWTFLGGCFFEDVVFYRGQFYAVTCLGEVAACDVGETNPKLTLVGVHDYDPKEDIDRHRGNGDSLYYKDYLVVLSGELLRVTRIVESIISGPNCHGTLKFVVHKLEGHDHAGTWNKVKSIGDRALFLGGSSSVSFATSEVHDGRCRRNCIYFLADYGCSDMGVFDMEDGSIRTFGINSYNCSSNSFYCSRFLYAPQFWISLALW